MIITRIKRKMQNHQTLWLAFASIRLCLYRFCILMMQHRSTFIHPDMINDDMLPACYDVL